MKSLLSKEICPFCGGELSELLIDYFICKNKDYQYDYERDAVYIILNTNKISIYWENSGRKPQITINDFIIYDEKIPPSYDRLMELLLFL